MDEHRNISFFEMSFRFGYVIISKQTKIHFSQCPKISRKWFLKKEKNVEYCIQGHPWILKYIIVVLILCVQFFFDKLTAKVLENVPDMELW